MKITTLEYCLKVTDGTHETPKKSNKGCPLITSKNILGGTLDMTGSYLISKEDFDNINKRSKVDQWDILFSMIGSVGEVYLERSENPGYAIKNIGVFKMGGDKNKAIRLYYYLSSPLFKRKSGKVLSGSVQSFLSLGFLRSIELPDLDNIDLAKLEALETIIDRIRLNERKSGLLKEYAQLLFYKWFIDFNFPNEEGWPYKDNGGEMIEVDGRLIPKKWSIGRLKDLGEIVGGATPSTSIPEYFTDSGIPWLTPKDLSLDHSVFISNGETDITELGYKNSSTKIMPKGSILFTSRAPIGYIAISSKEVTTNQGFKSMIPKENIPSEFLYLLLKNLIPVIERNASGTTFKEVSGTVVGNIKTIIPSIKTLGDFERQLKPQFDKIKSEEEESRLLKEIRDLLIRKMFSN